MYPEADVPVFQLSVQSNKGPAYHLALGQALQTLRAEGVLVLGSGSLTHDLSQFWRYRDALAEPEPLWVSAFADWFDFALEERRIDDLIDYRTRAPFAARNHPTEEHLLPLFVALGACGDDASVERLHASTTHGVLRMDVFAFGGGQ
jgi:4,5-DOPA dioxygenase extradiol